jgi:hypothetical protein
MTSVPSVSNGRRYGISDTPMRLRRRTSTVSMPTLAAIASISRSRTNVLSKRPGAR